eukprot:scaffold5624_cov73-Skeletonema_marinoi.AAC.1
MNCNSVLKVLPPCLDDADTCIEEGLADGGVEIKGKENGSVTILPLYNDTAVEDYLAANPDSLILGGSWDSAPKMKNKVVISDIGESPQKAIDDGVDVNEAQAEWLEPVGSLFNQEKFAHTYNLERKQRYECHTDNAAQLAAVADDARPKVLWGYFSDYSSGFDAPASPNYYGHPSHLRSNYVL